MRDIVILCIIIALAGCAKKATKIQIAPDVNKAIEQTAKKEYPKQYFGVAEKKKENETVTIFFEFNSDKLDFSEVAKLEKFVNKPENIDIRGYTCTIGTDDYNMGLSLARANRVKEYVGYGDVVAFGETMCDTVCKEITDCTDCRKVEVVTR